MRVTDMPCGSKKKGMQLPGRRERQYKLAPNTILVSSRFLRFMPLVLRKIECSILIN